MHSFLVLGAFSVCTITVVQAVQDCIYSSMISCPLVLNAAVNCCYDRYWDKVCDVVGGEHDKYLADPSRGADIFKVLCSQTPDKMPAQEVYKCYTQCGVNQTIIDTCQIANFGGILNTGDIINKKICNGKPQWVSDYMRCMGKRYNSIEDQTADAIQVNFCQARAVGILVDPPQILKNIFGGWRKG